MGRPSARQRKAYDSDAILDVAVRVFRERGYDGSTLDNVARAAGITKASIYYHVRSKEELLARGVGRALDARHLQICINLLEKEWPGLGDEHKSFITKQLRAGFVFLSMVLWEPPNQFWDLPEYFLHNHRILLQTAREAGLGILTYEQQADNWRLAIARVRKLVERWGIQFPAIPELDIEGVDVGDIGADDIIPVF